LNGRENIPVKLDTYKPLRDVVFETMREAILKQVLKPGERLMEVRLAKEMGVSRTPVREAIKKLEMEGFVVLAPRKGAYVAELSPDDVREIYEIRAGLEVLACGLAAERATVEQIKEMERFIYRATEQLDSGNVTSTVRSDMGFHELIYLATCNERLITILYNISEQVFRIRAASILLPGRKKESLEEHRKIMEAISSRNIDLARRLAQEHIEHAERAMNKYLLSVK
jgi:DNA-binding GntR family transcriptional regulator